MKVLIDSREQNPWIFRKPTVCALKTGDYSVAGFEDQICIERKGCVSEIATNFTQDRFWREMERMSKFPKKICIFEFSEAMIAIYPKGSGIPKWRQRFIRVKPPFLFKCIDRIRTEYCIEVVMLDNKKSAQTFAKIWLKNSLEELQKNG